MQVIFCSETYIGTLGVTTSVVSTFGGLIAARLTDKIQELICLKENHQKLFFPNPSFISDRRVKVSKRFTASGCNEKEIRKLELKAVFNSHY